MVMILGHISALQYWRSIGALDPSCLKDVPVKGQRFLASIKPTATEINDLEQRGFSFLNKPIHLLVPNADARCRYKNAKCYILPKHLPRKTLFQISEDIVVSSPEYCFIQMATLLSFAKLVQLGFEMCGTYRIEEIDQRGFRQAEPLSNTKKLNAFIRNAENTDGIVLARKAIRFIADGSASPMETLLAELLCTSRRLGGYGLPLPRMNYRIDTGRRAKRAAAKSYYVCDLYWPEANLAVEYDSDMFHTGSDRIARDASRRNALAYRGIRVVTVTKHQIMNPVELERVANLLTKELGVRIRSRSNGNSFKQIAFRDELLMRQKQSSTTFVNPFL